MLGEELLTSHRRDSSQAQKSDAYREKERRGRTHDGSEVNGLREVSQNSILETGHTLFTSERLKKKSLKRKSSNPKRRKVTLSVYDTSYYMYRKKHVKYALQEVRKFYGRIHICKFLGAAKAPTRWQFLNYNRKWIQHFPQLGLNFNARVLPSHLITAIFNTVSNLNNNLSIYPTHFNSRLSVDYFQIKYVGIIETSLAMTIKLQSAGGAETAIPY